MALIDWVDDRLDRWARWCISGRSSSNVTSGYGDTMLATEYEGDGYREPRAPITTWEDECRKTDKAVAQLDEADQNTVMAYYVHGSSMAQDVLGIGRSALSQRLSRIHIVLADLFVQEVKCPVVPIKKTIVESWFDLPPKN
jgi:hypothetical protein